MERLLVRVIAASLALLGPPGCSLFGPRMKTISVSSDPEGARVILNGEPVGTAPLRPRVRRSEDVLIEVREPGYQPGFRTSHRSLSTLGIIDVVGGAVWLVPFFSLLSSAAWEHEPSAYAIILEPEDAQRE